MDHFLVNKFLIAYPIQLQEFLKATVIISQEDRFIGKEKVEGSYDIETGQVILWNPKEDEEDFFIVLTHEWGHKVYHEWISKKQREEWLFIRSIEKIDFGLKKTYSAIRIPEEEYCTVFSLVSLVLYLRKIQMNKKSEKLYKKIKQEFPKAAQVVENQMKMKNKANLSLNSSVNRNITKKEVESLKKWIHQVIDKY